MTFNPLANSRFIAMSFAVIFLSAVGVSETQAAEGTYVNGSITRINDDQFSLDAFTTRAGWNFSKYFGVEGELSLPTGEDQQPFTTFELDRVLGIFATARIDVSDNFEVFARTGLIDSKVDVRIDAQNEAFTVNQNSAAIGAGVHWFPAKSFGLRAGYTYAKSDAFDAGIVIRF